MGVAAHAEGKGNQCDLSHVCPNACCRWQPNQSAPQLALKDSWTGLEGFWQALHETKRQLLLPFAQILFTEHEGFCGCFGLTAQNTRKVCVLFSFSSPLSLSVCLDVLVIFWAGRAALKTICSCLALRAHSSKSSFEKGCSPTIWKTLRSDPGSPTNNCIISQSHALLASDTQKTCSSTQSSRLPPPTPQGQVVLRFARCGSKQLSKSDFHWVRSGGKTDHSIFSCIQGVRNKSQDERIGWKMLFLDGSHFRTMVQTPLYKKLKCCCCCSVVSMQVHPPRGHTANILQGPSNVSSLVASTTAPCSCKYEHYVVIAHVVGPKPGTAVQSLCINHW